MYVTNYTASKYKEQQLSEWQGVIDKSCNKIGSNIHFPGMDWSDKQIISKNIEKQVWPGRK